MRSHQSIVQPLARWLDRTHDLWLLDTHVVEAAIQEYAALIQHCTHSAVQKNDTALLQNVIPWVHRHTAARLCISSSLVYLPIHLSVHLFVWPCIRLVGRFRFAIYCELHFFELTTAGL